MKRTLSRLGMLSPPVLLFLMACGSPEKRSVATAGEPNNGEVFPTEEIVTSLKKRFDPAPGRV